MTLTLTERAWLAALWRQAERDAGSVFLSEIDEAQRRPAPPFPFPPKFPPKRDA